MILGTCGKHVYNFCEVNLEMAFQKTMHLKKASSFTQTTYSTYLPDRCCFHFLTQYVYEGHVALNHVSGLHQHKPMVALGQCLSCVRA